MTEDGKRLTTRESARKLGCMPSDALPLLRAARIPHARCGSAYLWDAEGVERLVGALNGGEAERAAS